MMEQALSIRYVNVNSWYAKMPWIEANMEICDVLCLAETKLHSQQRRGAEAWTKRKQWEAHFSHQPVEAKNRWLGHFDSGPPVSHSGEWR